MKILKILFCLMLASAVANAQWAPRNRSVTVQPGVTRPSQPSVMRPAQEMTTRTGALCRTPLQIEVVQPSGLKSAAEGMNEANLGEIFSVNLRVNGGLPPYRWSWQSGVESIYPDAYCRDLSRCLPPMWNTLPTSDPVNNATYGLQTGFDNSNVYCRSRPELLMSGEIRDPATGYTINPSVCTPEATFFGETLTVSVEDSCPPKQIAARNFAFKLQVPSERTSDLLFAEIHIRGNDTTHSDYINIELLQESGHGSSIIAKTYNLRPREDEWRTFRVGFETVGDIDLNDVDYVKVSLHDVDGDLFDVDINYVAVSTKFHFFIWEGFIDDLEGRLFDRYASYLLGRKPINWIQSHQVMTQTRESIPHVEELGP